jgi:hypothetical protein
MEYLKDLKKGVWTEIYSHQPIDIYRRNLQQVYMSNAIKMFVSTNEIVMTGQLGGINIYMNPDVTKSDGGSIMRAHLVELRTEIKNAIPFASGLTKLHLEEMVRKINVGLIPKTYTTPTP